MQNSRRGGMLDRFCANRTCAVLPPAANNLPADSPAHPPGCTLAASRTRQPVVLPADSRCHRRVGSTRRICRRLWRQGWLHHRGRHQLHQPHLTPLARGPVLLHHGCRVRAIDDVPRDDIFAVLVLVRVRQTDHALTVAHRFEKRLRPRRVHVLPSAIAHSCLPHVLAREFELD